MNIFLHKSIFFTVVMMMFAFVGNVNAALFTISTQVTYNATYAGGDIAIMSGGVFTINSNAQINTITVNNGGTLYVNSPYRLTVGVNTNPYSTQVVDFQNNCTVLINSGASLVVYGNLNNSNNSTGVTFDGLVNVIGNVTGGNGSQIVGSGSLSTAGSIITQKTGSIFGSTNDCNTGPCNVYICPIYSLSNVSAVAAVCTSPKTSNVTLTSTATGLPTGSYTVSYTLSYNGNSATYTAPMTVTTAGTGQFTASLSPMGANNSTTIRIDNLASGICNNAISSSNVSNTVNMYGPITPIANSGYASCASWNAQWNNDTFVSGYFLDVATTNTFNTGTYVGIFQDLNVGNILIYPITGLTPGNTYYYRVRNINLGCGVSVYSNVVTFVAPAVVAPAPTISAITQPTCSTPTGSFTITNYVSWHTYNFSPSSGVTISGASVTAPVGTYTISDTNSGCTSANTSFTIYTQPPSPVPTYTSTKPGCPIAKGSITITNIASTGDTYSFNNGSSYQVSNTKVGLVADSYSIKIKNASGCESVATTVNLIAATTIIYNGSWPTTPDLTTIGIIAVSGTLSTNANLCSCTINTGINAIVAAGVTLTLQDKLTVSGTGTLTFNDTASLVQINNVANSGNITYKRNTTQVLNTDYTYWSTPVSPQTLGGVSPTSVLFYSFDLASYNWIKQNSGTTMSNGIGYIIRGPEANSTRSVYAASFFGLPNNGDITTVSFPATSAAVGLESSVLLGNPYPSALDANSFITNNAVLEGTLYFWTHNTSIQLATNITNHSEGSGAYAYTSDDYATYNLTGGTATFAAALGAINTNIPSGKIAAGQGFFAGIKPAGGSVNFRNIMRVGVGVITGNNSQFFKRGETIATTTIEKNRLWLNLSNAQGAFKQTLVGYVTGATNDYDNRFDGETFDGQEFVDFYSVNQNKNLTIQGRALPFDENDLVPIGFRTTIDGAFTINIDQVDGVMTNQAVFIEDKLTNTITDLKSGAYTFNTAAGTFNERFVLRYTNKTLGTNNFVAKDNQVLVSNKNKQITINSFSETIDKVTVYDLLGRQIYHKGNVNNNELTILNLASSHQTLVVKTILQNGQTINNKIIY